MTTNSPWRGRTVALWLIAVCVTGCGKTAPDYTPNPSAAEDAVRQSLDAWKAGQPVGIISGSQPSIHTVDAGRKPGQLLADYAILGETRATASGRTFAVRLELTNPAEQMKTQYIVVGIDPLWVFRQEDYELLSHWDHHMPAEKPDAEKPDSEKPNPPDISSEVNPPSSR